MMGTRPEWLSITFYIAGLLSCEVTFRNPRNSKVQRCNGTAVRHR